MSVVEEYTFAIDRSGSMITCGNGTFQGLKKFIKDKKEYAKEENITLKMKFVTFDDAYEMKEFPENPFDWTDETYNELEKSIRPRGYTLLYDTIDYVISYMVTKREEQEKQEAEKDPEESKIKDIRTMRFVIILTDGDDNMSVNTQGEIREKIKTHSKTGVEYIFLGANIDARVTGSGLGINDSACLQFSANPRHTRDTFTSLGLAVRRSIETDGDLEFTGLERQQSCTKADYTRFSSGADANSNHTYHTSAPARLSTDGTDAGLDWLGFSLVSDKGLPRQVDNRLDSQLSPNLQWFQPIDVSSLPSHTLQQTDHPTTTSPTTTSLNPVFSSPFDSDVDNNFGK